MTGHPLDRIERIPRTCIWSITGVCNLRCVHCENNCGEKGANELPFDRMLQVAEELRQLGCKTVEVTGGEPLLHKRWDELCTRLSSLGMQVAIITNGTLLDDEALDRALDAGVGVFAISIDGMQKVHDATRLRATPGPSPWQQTMECLQCALERTTAKVITQVNKQNLGQLPEMRRMLGNLGVKHWQLQLAMPAGRLLDLDYPYVIAPEELKHLTAFIMDAIKDGRAPFIDVSDTIGYYTDRELTLRKRTTGQGVWLGCQAGIRVMAISYEGKVRGCSALPSEFDAGSLHHESLKQIWSDAERFAYSTCFDPDKLTGACAGCKWGALCRAGCTSMAYWTTGTVYSNPHCLHALETRMRPVA